MSLPIFLPPLFYFTILEKCIQCDIIPLAVILFYPPNPHAFPSMFVTEFH